MKTDGRSLLLAQIKSGVRSIVEDVDNLRIKYGHDKIEVLTPKVETRLRSGFLPAIPLRIKIQYNEVAYIIATYEVGYPGSTPLKLEFEFFDNFRHQQDTLDFESLIQSVYAFCNKKNDENHQDDAAQFPRSIEILQYFNDFLNSSIPRSISTKVDNNINNNNDVANSNMNIVSIEKAELGGPVEESAEIRDDGLLNDDAVVARDDNSSSSSINTAAVIIPNEDAEYKCATCRTVLFHHRHLLISPCHQNNYNYNYNNKSSVTTAASTSTSKCSSYFLESLPEWHYTASAAHSGTSDMSANGGKVFCPNSKCRSKLGHWHWAGVQCGCSAWVTPGFQIIKSKVDMQHNVIVASLPVVLSSAVTMAPAIDVNNMAPSVMPSVTASTLDVANAMSALLPSTTLNGATVVVPLPEQP